MSPRRRPVHLAVLALVLGVIASTLMLLALVLGVIASSLMLLAPSAQAADNGRIRGAIIAKHGLEKVTMRWFDANWTYLGSRAVRGGAYSISLPAGRYHLQFVDERPQYDITKYAPTDKTVTVRANSTRVKNVRLRRGAVITGTVRTGTGKNTKVAQDARVVAANTLEQSFEVQTNDLGQFAIGGLPKGKYSVFTYDKRKRYVSKSDYAGRLKAGKSKNLKVRLDQRAGRLLVDLYAEGKALDASTYVTAVSRKTGQFWTEKARHGSVTFRGLYPGRYKVVVTAFGDWLGEEGKVRNGTVKPGRVAFGSYTLTQKGASAGGTLVRGDDPSQPVRDAVMRLYSATGQLIAESGTDSAGRFYFHGPITTQAVTLVAFNQYDTSYGQLTLPITMTQGAYLDLGQLALPKV